MRHTAQCIGRVMRSKMDYGIMILADQRFSKPSRIKKLPKWIQDNLSPANIGLGSDDAVELAKKFLKDMAQELPLESQIGVSMLNEEQLKSEKFLKRLETLQQAALETVGPFNRI
uniref:General transcription and DNA repair factor IIH helicase subunit XPD (Trinotate prediction) n=1 Tax=Henneguya salminicola TaxID=69463 RepID=A0A6G3MIM8_HENSL